MAAAAPPLQQLPSLQPYDIICGPDFNGQTVACLPPNQELKIYLAGFINLFVNTLLRESGIRKQSCTPVNIWRLKRTIFVICSTLRFYTMFANYMNEMPNVDVDGVRTPLFNMNYIQNLNQPFKLTISADDGMLIDCKILHLFVGGLAYHMLATVGWLREPHPGSPGVTLNGFYTLFLPDNTLVPQNVINACEHTIGTSIQKAYVTHSVLFFGIGSGTGTIEDELRRRPGHITTYVANTDTRNPPIPESNIVWNNANQIESNMIFLSYKDQSGTDIEIILQSVTGGTLLIRDMMNPVNFQEWQIADVDVVADHYVQYTVRLTQGQWQVPNGTTCQLIIMRPGQTVPTINDELSHQITNFTRQIGGVKKRQNKSKRRKNNRSNKKIKSRRRHNVKRSYRRNRFY
jgi:hypothetical protein